MSGLEAALKGRLLEAQGAAQAVTESASLQENLLAAIFVANEAFVRARKTDPLTVDRDDMVC